LFDMHYRSVREWSPQGKAARLAAPEGLA
jgi:hypothetical protein